VELIVVITILAILWTIAFISLQWYSRDARNSTRVADVNSIEKALELFTLKRWQYPMPSNYKKITYSWWLVFYSGNFWKSTITNVNVLSKLPVDPLFWNEYSYWLDSIKQSYNISWIEEWWSVANNTNLVNSAYAANSWYTPKVSGNYNWIVSKTSTGGVTYVLFIPSLILSDTTQTEIKNLDNKFVYSNISWIPSSYTWKYIPDSNLIFSPRVVYSWSSLPRTPVWVKKLVTNLQNEILWTTLYSNKFYKELISIDLNNTDQIYYFWLKIINSSLWWRFALKYYQNCKEILDKWEADWDWEYIISPTWSSKITVYCDMTTDWWGWTRIRGRDSSRNFYDLHNTNDTKYIVWTEIMDKYTRSGKVKIDIWWIWTDVLFTPSQKYWFIVKEFSMSKCWKNYNTVISLIQHITGWVFWSCWWWGSYSDFWHFVFDQLWKNDWLTGGDKILPWFSVDPCLDWPVIDYGKFWLSFSSFWDIWTYISIGTWIRAYSTFSIGWWWSDRCDGVYWRWSWLSPVSEITTRGLDSTYTSWIDTNDVYIR